MEPSVKLYWRFSLLNSYPAKCKILPTYRPFSVLTDVLEHCANAVTGQASHWEELCQFLSMSQEPANTKLLTPRNLSAGKYNRFYNQYNLHLQKMVKCIDFPLCPNIRENPTTQFGVTSTTQYQLRMTNLVCCAVNSPNSLN